MNNEKPTLVDEIARLNELEIEELEDVIAPGAALAE
jgi:hypothetical protein